MKPNIYSKQMFIEYLSKYDIITFDLFNTLINRKVFLPDDVLQILDYKISKKYHLELKQFLNIRKKARINLAHKLKKVEYTLNDLYDQIQKITNWDDGRIKDIKNIEINTDISLSTPRTEMLDIYNALISMNKKIFIISDMYYSKNTIIKFLNKNNIFKYKDVWVSSEKQAKKADGSIWKKFCSRYKSNFIHVGDSHKGDYSKPKRLGIKSLKIKASYNQATHSKYNCVNKTIEDKIINGLIYNKCVFNSPFSNQKNPIDDPYKYGYSILGPLFLYFFIWINKKFADKKKLFLSRDGFFLEKLYIEFCKRIKIKPNSKYLLTSRRISCLSTLYNFNDISKYIKMYGYSGTTTNFFKNRFGIIISTKYNKKINHKISTSYTKKIAKIYKDKILNIAKNIRKNYTKYLKNNISHNSILIDLGYHSTTQINLSKILKQNIPGAYFLTVGKNKNNVYSCFNNALKIRSFSTSNKIFKYLNVAYFIRTIETVLSAPHGQLISMDNNGKPIFDVDLTIKNKIKSSYIITNACLDFINDFLDTSPLDINKTNLNLYKTYNNFAIFNNLLSKKYISKSLYETFVEENQMCGLNKHHMFKMR